MLNLFKKNIWPKAPSVRRIAPLSDIHTVLVFLDSQEASWAGAEEDITAFFRAHGISCKFYLLDTTEYKKGTCPETNPGRTLFGKDLNGSHKTMTEKVRTLFDMTPDLIISLYEGEEQPIYSLIRHCQSDFKIGRVESGEKEIFAMVISDPKDSELSQREAWKEIRKYLTIIK